MTAAVRIVATAGFAYVAFAGYAMFAASPARGATGPAEFFVAAIAGWVLAFFGGDAAQLLDLPDADVFMRGMGLSLICILAFVVFAQHSS